jgi:hypothetical protein
MPPYQVLCYEPNCGQLAEYKIAARWSDGVTSELKTYGLVCPACLPKWFQQSLAKQSACRRAPKEILEAPGIYRLQRGSRDVRLERLPELEQQLQPPSSADKK